MPVESFSMQDGQSSPGYPGHAGYEAHTGERGNTGGDVQAVNAPESKRSNAAYTVGWICALVTEYVAAQAFLDKKHKGPDYVSPSDNNHYTLGEIGKHNVVVAVLPGGEYGMASAAAVASHMLHTFSNVRIGLMVGIAGGAPSRKHDVRLGDIVVGVPRGGRSGVIYYDFGKAIQNQGLQRTGVLNQPPIVMRTALSGLEAQYETDGHCLEENINEILQKKPRLQKKYSRPDTDSDKLYESNVVHPQNTDLACGEACGSDLSKLVVRPEREKDMNMLIHYGTIASGSKLIRDATIRDALIKEEDILCFEMEAAGLMNHFPCLVIRGICDYSDTHKNDKWQGYAAMAAAAYAKDLLYQIMPNKVEAEKNVSDILLGIYKATEEHRDIAKMQVGITEEQLQIQKDLFKRKLSREEEKCHQLFRLATKTGDTTYEWYKGRVENRIPDTCLWLLNHKNFQAWLKQDSGPLLVSADPGCGKSVLAKYLIDEYLPRSATICYFFFKSQDQDTAKQALCAILHQLFFQRPSLIKHAMSQFRKDGENMIYSTGSLWNILRNATQDPSTGPVIIVLDALDECAESEVTDLVRNVESQFHNHWNEPRSGLLKYFLTCRPYEQVISKFHSLLPTFPSIQVPGEEESEIITQEINRVIAHKIDLLSGQKGLSSKIKSLLQEKFRQTTHRTYLWVYLVFNYLEEENFKKTQKGVEQVIATLPISVNQAYERILGKCKDEEQAMVQKALSLVLAATRPFTLAEMNIAMNIDATVQLFHDLDLEDERDFKSRLRSTCGLFISTHQGKVYLLHQTAREFLLTSSAPPVVISARSCWHYSITAQSANAVLAEACVRYLSFFDLNISSMEEVGDETGSNTGAYDFFDYSAINWTGHFCEADFVTNPEIMNFALALCDPEANCHQDWFETFWQSKGLATPDGVSNLMVTSQFGHHTMVKFLLDDGADVNAKDNQGRTSLYLAASNGHAAVAKLLLDAGAVVEAEAQQLWEPLLPLIPLHDTVDWFSLNKGSDIAIAAIKGGWTPLVVAATEGHEAIVKLLLDAGADTETLDSARRTPLTHAASNGHASVVKLLLEAGAHIEAMDDSKRTSLVAAASEGHEAVVKILLNAGANIEAMDGIEQTALIVAAFGGHGDAFKTLLDAGADIKARDCTGMNPLSYAASEGHEAIVKLLLVLGDDIETLNKARITPLIFAASNGHEDVVKVLLYMGAEIEAEDGLKGGTALLQAVKEGQEPVVRLLLNYGAYIETKDIAEHFLQHGPYTCYGQTPLLWAARRGYRAMVELLLDNKADIEAKDSRGRTPLLWATANGHDSVAKVLIDRGADSTTRDNSWNCLLAERQFFNRD